MAARSGDHDGGAHWRSSKRAAIGPGAVGNVDGISLELSQLRSSSEAATESLRGATDRLASAVDNNQQRLWDKLEDLGNRLNNLERSGGLLAGPVLAKLEQLDERLDRIERSAMALRVNQPPALASSSTPAAEPKAAQVQALAPTSEPKSSEKSQAPAETKKIAGWVVREVINGRLSCKVPKVLSAFLLETSCQDWAECSRLPARAAAGSWQQIGD